MSITVTDYEPAAGDLLNEAIHGLKQTPKQLPCKFFYDAKGAELFEQICELDEYYPTRTELGIMQDHLPEIAAAIGSKTRVVEYGSGEGLKTKLLLDALIDPVAYVPIDISKQQLQRMAHQLAERYPDLEILPICADYTATRELPQPKRGFNKTVTYFPGSTIGNFKPDQAVAFLAKIAESSPNDGGLLIGVDLKKPVDILEAAYNDDAGITAAFNLNLLRRLNDECGANFVLNEFEHQAVFNQKNGAIEMHLISSAEQNVEMGNQQFDFTDGEIIHTENSFKYSLQEFAELAKSAGWHLQQVWLDSNKWFSVQYFTNTAISE